MAKPEKFCLIKSARVPTAGSRLGMPWTLLDSLSAFSLPQKCPEVLLGHLAHCSQTLRTAGKIGQQNEYEEP